MLIRITLGAFLIISVFTGVRGQDKPMWVSQLEGVLQKPEGGWKVVEKKSQGIRGYFTETIILNAGNRRADVLIEIFDTDEYARDKFKGDKIFFTNTSGKHTVKSTLEGLGDDNILFTGNGGPQGGKLFVIQGNIVIQVIAPTAVTATRFARHAVDLMPPSHKP